MDRDSAKQLVKGYLQSYLQGKGINTRKLFKCLSPSHSDGHPSMGYKNNRCKCFSCGVSYDIFDLIAIDYGLNDDKEVFNKAYELYNISIDRNADPIAPKKPLATVQKQDESEQKEDMRAYFLKANERASETEYFHERGISDAVIDRFKLGYEPNFTQGTGGKAWQAVIIPTTAYTYTARNTAANAESKDRIRKKGNNVIFNRGVLQGLEPVFVVEGEFDALSIIEAGGEALALGSTANYRKLVEYLQKAEINTPLIILALDNDDAGRKTTQDILAELGEYKKAEIVSYDMYAEYKDANEMLMKDRAGLEEAVKTAKNILTREQEELAEEYRQSNAANHLAEFVMGIEESKTTPFIPTGFDKLDDVLEGGLYEGLYVVGAISSLGKTTFIMQISDQIAQTGHDVLIFSLEMARAEIIAKSISRLTLLDCLQNSKDMKLAKTSRGITTGKRYDSYTQEEKEIIAGSIDVYSQYGSRIYIQEGIGNIGVEQIKDAVAKHILFTGKKPTVIIDYLQILSPYDVHLTDKQNTDKAVLELKRMSRDYSIPVIGISSLNRQSYNSPIGMEAFKESGAIEYSSDVLLGMQLKGVGESNFDVNKAKQQNPREVEVVILKNRNGATGAKVAYEYYAMFNYFKECGSSGSEYVQAPADNDGFRPIIKGKTPFEK